MRKKFRAYSLNENDLNMLRWFGICLSSFLIASCSGGGANVSVPETVSEVKSSSFVLPAFNAAFDVQLAEQYTPQADIETLLLDRSFRPPEGRYSICYINGFQTQPNESDIWRAKGKETDLHLILRDENGNEIFDPGYPDEFLLDISTEAKRTALAEVIRPWIAQCVADGFDAVDFDNLDTYNRPYIADRPNPLITENDAVAFVSILNVMVHSYGLAAAQKNAPDLASRKAETGADFVIVEQCSEPDDPDAPEKSDNCRHYVDGFGDAVLMIEYDKDVFSNIACPKYGQKYSIILRDADFPQPASDATDARPDVYENC